MWGLIISCDWAQTSSSGLLLKVTTLYTMASVPLGLVLAFLLALLINTKVKGIAFFRTEYYLPSIVPAVASAILWAWIFNTEFGPLNALLRVFGIPRVAWLQDPSFALWALIMMSLWAVGAAMIIYLAGLQGIPQNLLRSRRDRRRRPFSPAFERHTAAVVSGDLLQLDFEHHRHFPGLYRRFPDHGWRPAKCHPILCAISLSQWLHVLEYGLLRRRWPGCCSIIILVLTLLIFRYVGGMVHYEDNG